MLSQVVSFIVVSALPLGRTIDTRQQLGVIDLNFTDTVFTNNILFVDNNARPRALCAAKCLNRHGCLSFTFTSGGGITSCRGYSAVMTSSDAGQSAPGTLLFSFSSWLNRECDEDHDCPTQNSECFAGKCLCTPGYYFSLSKRTCQTSCNETDLQAQYLAYEDMYIIDNNMKLCEKKPFAQACQHVCSAESTCRSADYNKVRRTCCLQQVTLLDVPDDLGHKPGFHFQRCCV